MASETPEDPFARLLLSVPALPSYPHPTLHEVRLRRNASKTPSPTDGRTLFLKNVPADATEAHLRAVFASLVGAGRFESAAFPGSEPRAGGGFDPAVAIKMAALTRKRKRGGDDDENAAPELPAIWGRKVHKSGSTALVTLADEKSLQLVLKAVAKTHKSKKYPAWPGDALGGDWITAHLRLSRADKAATQAATHAFFSAYNDREEEAAALAKRMRAEPDADGFVTVTRGAGRSTPASRAAADEAARKMAEKEEKRRVEMRGFYRFQRREARKEEQGRLRRRFEEDRRRVEGMREKRGKFKPEA